MDDQPNQHITDAIKLLCSCTSATLLVDSVPYDIRYIVDPRTGSLVLCASREMLQGDDVVCVIPEDRFDAPMRMSIELSEDISEEASDRFLAYHLHQDRPLSISGRINFAKLSSGAVIDQADIEHPNPLVDGIPALCRSLNRDRSMLASVCRLMTNATVEDPLAVGVDEYGFDARTPFGVLRVEFPAPVADTDECAHVIAALLDGVS